MEVVLLPDIVEAEEGCFGPEKAEKLSTGKGPSFSILLPQKQNENREQNM